MKKWDINYVGRGKGKLLVYKQVISLTGAVFLSVSYIGYYKEYLTHTDVMEVRDDLMFGNTASADIGEHANRDVA